MYSKLIKCNFFEIEVHYLGHVVSKEAITGGPKKIRDIMEWVHLGVWLKSNHLWVSRLLQEIHEKFLTDFLSYYIIAEERKEI